MQYADIKGQGRGPKSSVDVIYGSPLSFLKDAVGGDATGNAGLENRSLAGLTSFTAPMRLHVRSYVGPV